MRFFKVINVYSKSTYKHRCMSPRICVISKHLLRNSNNATGIRIDNVLFFCSFSLLAAVDAVRNRRHAIYVRWIGQDAMGVSPSNETLVYYFWERMTSTLITSYCPSIEFYIRGRSGLTHFNSELVSALEAVFFFRFFLHDDVLKRNR